MFGAMIGDIAGSPYKIKKYNVHTKDFQFLTEYSYYTEATVMTVAVAAAIMSAGNKYDENELENALIHHRIFHDSLNKTASVFYPEDRSWNTYRYEIPKSAVKLPRLKAEKLENLWSIQFYDDIMEKDEDISSAVTDHAVDPSDEKAAEIIELLIKKVHENGHLLMTKSESMDIAVKKIQKHSASLRSLDLSHTLIIFSDYTALHRGPDIDTETVPAKNVFETVINHPEYNYILLNGFTVGFLIGKDDALNILENDPV